MSRRGRSKDVAISLFSFQDIITSVTAIMILLVLILALELVTRVATKGMAAEDRRVAQQLKRSVAEMEKRLDQLRKEASAAQAAASDAAGFSAKETAEKQAKAARAAKELQDEIRRLEVQLRDAQSSRRTAEGRLAASQTDDPEATAARAREADVRAAQMEAANREEKRRQESEAKKASDGTATARTLVFNAPPGTTLEPLLVEIAKDGLVAVGPDGESPSRFAWNLLGLSAGFGDWLKGRNKSREYVVLILRPSGVERYEAVREAVVSAGFDVGTELIGEQMSLVLGPR
ncbi:MAG: hypothetical protein NTY87_00060 [Planctomycetia bacterium]|nr:hypothetical protein [Planctomycetia bacterium]